MTSKELLQKRKKLIDEKFKELGEIGQEICRDFYEERVRELEAAIKDLEVLEWLKNHLTITLAKVNDTNMFYASCMQFIDKKEFETLKEWLENDK